MLRIDPLNPNWGELKNEAVRLNRMTEVNSWLMDVLDFVFTLGFCMIFTVVVGLTEYVIMPACEYIELGVLKVNESVLLPIRRVYSKLPKWARNVFSLIKLALVTVLISGYIGLCLAAIFNTSGGV